MTTPLPPEWNSWLGEGLGCSPRPRSAATNSPSTAPRDPKFALGDFLGGIPSQYTDLLAEALHIDRGQFRIYRDVAVKIPPARRVAPSWTVHRDLRGRTDLLTDGLTVRVAGALLGKKPIDTKPDRRLPVEDRAANVRAGLADPEVYALIDNELARGRTERQLRNRARQVHTEHGKRSKDLEAELHSLRQAKSPFEATVDAELQISKAACG